MLNSALAKSKRHGRYLIATTAVGLLALAGCSGNPTSGSDSTAPASSQASSESAMPSSESMSPSASSESASPSDTAATGPGYTALMQAARTALAKIADSTLISIESERNGTAWEVQVITSDGTEQEMELSADGTQVVTGPVTKNEGISDKSKHLDRVNTAKLDYEKAAQKILSAVPKGNITELNLDSEQGTTVWEADVVDESNLKHSVQIDATSGELLNNSTGSDD